MPPGLTSVIGVACGDAHSLALNSDGTVTAWGSDQSGQVDVPPGLVNVVAVSAGSNYSLALKNDGTVVVWGDQAPAPVGLTNVVAIAAGRDHSLALKRDGTVVVWGTQSSVPDQVTNVVAIAAGNGDSLALRADGYVIAWGDNSFGKTDVPPGLSNVVAIAAGRDHNLALKRDGRVVAWGANDHGQTDVPLGLNVAAIAAGGQHSVALTSSGTLRAWGDNTLNQTMAPGSTNFFAVAAGGFHSLALRGDGSPVITVQPFSQKVFISKSAAFQVIVVGTAPLYFRWLRDGTNIIGATTTSILELDNVQLTDAGSYSVVVSNALNTTTSAPAMLIPTGEVPFLTEQPQDATVLCGEGTEFHAGADGTKPLGFQWLFNDVPIAGATGTNLVLSTIAASQAGHYAVVVTNAFGVSTSAVAQLVVEPTVPTITSPLTASGKQGRPFTYTITGLRMPTSFAAANLPPGLGVDPVTGKVSGTPLESGTFGPTISAIQSCGSDTETLVITISSSVPTITSAPTASGVEGMAFSYQIRATDSPMSFGATDLPFGLGVDPVSGLISGTPVYAGDFVSTISASNVWGVGVATLHFTFGNAAVAGLSISDVTFNYSAPYLLDFQFSLRDDNNPTNGNAIIVDPALLSVVCMEDGRTISPSETAVIKAPAAMKQGRSFLVLDFTESIATLANGDTNANNVSDALEDMVRGAENFVNQQAPEAQVGVYEFHREDQDPQQISALTTDKPALDAAIGGIYTNFVQGFSAGSRGWDAMVAAINDLGAANPDEQHFVVFVSDGKDESSLNTVTNVVAAATNASVKVYCIGFGAELDSTNLQYLATSTDGRYYDAAAVGGLTAAFDQIGKELKGIYLLRWATLQRSPTAFMPTFQVTYQGLMATSPPNPVTSMTNVDTNMPPMTNIVMMTNFIIGPYTPTDYAGDVTVGSLRLVANAVVQPGSVTLRASYVPRDIRRLRIHYQPNWPCTASLLSTGNGEILSGWTLSETNDGAGGRWLELRSADPQVIATSIPFGALGNLVKFSLQDLVDASNAFTFFDVDNTIYTNTGGQSFVIEDTNSFIAVYPALAHGTPVPWLMANGFMSNFAMAELSDPDGDDVPTWQEYRANTNPQDPKSRLAVASLAMDPYGRNQITFNTALSRTYRLEASTDFLNWQIVQDNIPGTGTVITILDRRYLPGVTYQFYRLAVY